MATKGYVQFYNREQIRELDLRTVRKPVNPFPRDFYRYEPTITPRYMVPYQTTVKETITPDACPVQKRDLNHDYFFKMLGKEGERSTHPTHFSRYSMPVGVFGYTEVKPGFMSIGPGLAPPPSMKVSDSTLKKLYATTHEYREIH